MYIKENDENIREELEDEWDWGLFVIVFILLLLFIIRVFLLLFTL